MRFIAFLLGAIALASQAADAAVPAGTQADPIYIVITTGGAVLSGTNALPVYGPKSVNTNPIPFKVGLTPTSVALVANTCRTLVAANPNRNSLRWQVTGSNPASVSPGGCPLTAPMNYSPPYASGQQGGGDTFVGELSTGQFSAVSTASTTISVWEGQ